jgi:hypothetical protein
MITSASKKVFSEGFRGRPTERTPPSSRPLIQCSSVLLSPIDPILAGRMQQRLILRAERRVSDDERCGSGDAKRDAAIKVGIVDSVRRGRRALAVMD